MMCGMIRQTGPSRPRLPATPLLWLLLLCLLAACTAVPPIITVQPPTVTATVAVTVTATVPPAPTETQLLPPSATPPAVATPQLTSTARSEPTATPEPTDTSPLVFAVIGDYGTGGPGEAAVAELVKSWEPELIITVGDNNYPSGEAETIDDHIGQFYHEFIHPYQGEYGAGADVNRFFPTLGNHDWQTDNAQPYLDYFTLPGNERYYDFVWGPVHFFALDGDGKEPDGNNRQSVQAQWLQEQLAASTSPWKLVYFHHTPYSSARHGSYRRMQWPFAEWGASAVLAGHDHTYERLEVDGLPYFVNGLSGDTIYNFEDPLPQSIVRYNRDLGAMRITATETVLTFEFITREQLVIDFYQLEREADNP